MVSDGEFLIHSRVDWMMDIIQREIDADSVGYDDHGSHLIN
jgi:hypothetical protein